MVKHIEGDRFPVGELDGASTERVQRVSALLQRGAGFKAPVLDNIRVRDLAQAWGNLTFNPIGSLSHSTLVDICPVPAIARTRRTSIMCEASAGPRARASSFA